MNELRRKETEENAPRGLEREASFPILNPYRHFQEDYVQEE
jgi:hypothetical protein